MPILIFLLGLLLKPLLWFLKILKPLVIRLDLLIEMILPPSKRFIIKHKYIFQIIIAIFILCVVIYSYTKFLQNNFNSWQNRGVFGDSFGGLNVIFSGLAFIAALLTLISTLRQYKEDKIRASADRQDSENAIKISALQSYIQSETNTENIGVAKLILKNLTEKIFYNEEYNEIMAPNLEIKQVKYEIHNVTNELQIRVNFKNNHPSSFLLQVRTSDDNYSLFENYTFLVCSDLRKITKIKPNTNYSICISGLKEKLKSEDYLPLLLKGCIVEKIWWVTVYFNPNNDRISHHSEEPQLVYSRK